MANKYEAAVDALDKALSRIEALKGTSALEVGELDQRDLANAFTRAEEAMHWLMAAGGDQRRRDEAQTPTS